MNWNGNKGRVCFFLCFQATDLLSFFIQIFKNSPHDSESLKYCVLFSTVWYVWCLRMLFVKWSESEDIHRSWAHAGVRAKCWMTTEGWGSPDRLGHQVTHYCYMLRVHSTHRCANQSEWIKPTSSQRIHLAWNDHKPFLTDSNETMSWEILDKLNKRMNIKKLFLELGAKMH